ncbi:MAG: hypothetical protein ACLQGP_27785 [Isosphaeraceae bacterium]
MNRSDKSSALLLAAANLVGWLAANGRPTSVAAQQPPGPSIPSDGKQLPRLDPLPREI